MLTVAVAKANEEGFRCGKDSRGALFLLATGHPACTSEGAMGRWGTKVVRALMPECPGATARSVRRATADYFCSCEALGDDEKEGALQHCGA